LINAKTNILTLFFFPPLFFYIFIAFVTEPITGSVHPFMEHLMYTAVFAIPLLGPFFQGNASKTMFYTYMIGFDVMNMIGHCNFEFMPRTLMNIPGMKYLIYTPSYHSLHHSRIHCNFCLFMPLYDAMFGTVNWKVTDTLYDQASQGLAVPITPPDVVFVGHGTTLTSAFHAPFALRSFSSRPFVEHWYLKLAWPFCALIAILVRLFGKPYTHDRHRLRHLVLETWVTPAFAIQFFFPSQWPWINDKIQSAILAANDSGVKVIGLGALNKNEALNGGGKLFVDTLGDRLKVRVVHGNTLTAAAVIQKIPLDAQEVFVTGATSKLGRAISLYLAETRGIRVVMYTKAKERFDKIRDEASDQAKPLLIHASKMEAGANIRDWIVGKFCSPKDQAKAPAGATFHQFVVPPLVESRKKDCHYTELPAFRMPPDTKDFKTCEMTMQRNCVHACHAGAVVHALEGWDYHEVGAIDYTRIDATWEAAVKHGLVLQ
jgi:WAX2 C-terminal domain/Fatty acid hydroxylase superfamily